MQHQIALQYILRRKYEEVRMKNAAYSLRAFSKRVGLSPAMLSRVLNGKRNVSKKIAEEIAARLALDPQERSELLSKFPKTKRTEKSDEVDSSYLQLTADQYQVVAEWQAFAILNLIGTKGFKSDVEFIARRLNLSVSKTKESIVRLLRLEMLEIDSKGKFKRVKSRFRTTDDVANLSLRKSHYQNLDLAKNSLDQDPVDKRDFTWVTAAIDTKKIPQAKILIRKFQDDLLDLLEDKAEPNEVYRMVVQLFPLSHTQQNKTENEK